MMLRLVWLALSLLCVAMPAWAQCTGSGIAWSCPAGSTIAQVETAMSSASDNATLTFASGAYTWTTGTVDIINNKGVTLICATVRGCTMTIGGNKPISMEGAVSGQFDKAVRVSGFVFTGGTCNLCFWFYPVSSPPAGTRMTNVRFDHNTFLDLGGATTQTDLLFFGEQSRAAKWKALIDNNIFEKTGTGGQYRMVFYSTADHDDYASTMAGSAGSDACIYLEDNEIIFAAPTISGFGFVDGENAACWVFRFNTVTNARVLSHGVTHGWGPVNWEAYGNVFVRTTDSDGIGNAFRILHHQGSGTWFVWGNQIDPFGTISSGAIALQHYRDTTLANHGSGGEEICDGTNAVDGNTSPEATHRGYPCKNQPGRAPAGGSPGWGTLSPIAVFRNVNTDTSAKVDVVSGCAWGAPCYSAEHVVSNRDYYNAVSVDEQTSATSPFAGTSGVGHGTLVNRPTTCTHTTSPDGDDGGGVMYWATDQGSWNTSSTNPEGVDVSGADGILYRCSATDTWSAYYTPYTYPHPLGGGGGGGGGTGTRPRLRIRLVSVPVPVAVTLVLFGGVYAIQRRTRA